MIEDEIGRFVRDHYRTPDARLLLLSNLGAQLIEAGLWPPPNEKRTLHEAVEATPAISVVRDPEAASFIGVVPRGEEQRAFDAMTERKKRVFLRKLPRALLLAFAVELAEGQKIFLRLKPKPLFSVGTEAPDDDYLEVEPDLRIPGLAVSDAAKMAAADAARLEQAIRAWCARHGLDPDDLPRRPSADSTPAIQPKGLNALERLYEAQDADVAKRLAVPIDIALALSRMP